MIDSKQLRHEPEIWQASLERRGSTWDMAQFLQLDERRAALQSETQALQAARNQHSKQIGILKAGGQPVDSLKQAVSEMAVSLQRCELELAQCLQAIEAHKLNCPNRLLAEVPDGASEQDNQVLSSWGELPQWGFSARDHIELGGRQMDFERAAKLSGARFVVLSGELARLHRALAQFMLDWHVQEHGYLEVAPPFIVKEAMLYGTGQLPKFADDQYSVSGDGCLIPTAEVPLCNLHRDEIINLSDLPLRYVAHTPCFRQEAGSYGRDVRGMIRQHQFEKVECVQFVEPGASEQAHQQLVGHAASILQQLNLPYREVLLCAGDTGFTAQKTIDLEVWMPGQNAYREIASCSQCGDFQARRMKVRYRQADGKTAYLHTLNGSGVAVGRALIAVMENYQQEDGSIVIPEVLRPYMRQKTSLNAQIATEA